ncbi:hypothetical protein [Rhodocaloribacter sp.]
MEGQPSPRIDNLTAVFPNGDEGNGAIVDPLDHEGAQQVFVLRSDEVVVTARDGETKTGKAMRKRSLRTLFSMINSCPRILVWCLPGRNSENWKVCLLRRPRFWPYYNYEFSQSTGSRMATFF